MNLRPLTKLQQDALNVICDYRKNNPITGKEIADIIKLSERGDKKGATMRAVINALRDKGYPVCASSRGYYYPANTQDLRDYIVEFRGRIYEQQKACDCLNEALNEWEAEEKNKKKPAMTPNKHIIQDKLF